MSETNRAIGLSATAESVNASYSPTRVAVRRRARRGLRPVEAALLSRYGTLLSGSVLELGSRGDGLTRALYHHAEDFTGLAFSAPEAALCRAEYLDASFPQLNVADLSAFEDQRFDAVVAGRYALDRLSDPKRRRVLAELARIIADGGVLIFSSHNLARESLVTGPVRHMLRRPWRLGQLPQALSNRARLGPLQERSHGYAVLNDPTGGYSWLTYYVSREHQERQLIAENLVLLECVDRSDVMVSAGAHAYHEAELHYVAQRAGE